jgi:hypothetical protein
MPRLLVLLFLLASVLFGAAIQPCPLPTCPTISFIVDGTDISSNFTAIPGEGPNGTVFHITGSFSNPSFSVTLDAFTQPDPVIDFGMSFDSSADPSVSLTITSPYSGGPFSGFDSSSSGQITPGANTIGNSFVQGNFNGFIQEFFINGVLVDSSNPGCNYTGAPGQTLPCPNVQPASFSKLAQIGGFPIASVGGFPDQGTIELAASFNISAGDHFVLSGSGILTPEPATGSLMFAGVLALAGIALRRASNRV